MLRLKNGSIGSEGKTTRVLGKRATKSSILREPWSRSTPSAVTGNVAFHIAKTGWCRLPRAAIATEARSLSALRNNYFHHVARGKTGNRRQKSQAIANLTVHAHPHSRPERIPARRARKPLMLSTIVNGRLNLANRAMSPLALTKSSLTYGCVRAIPRSIRVSLPNNRRLVIRRPYVSRAPQRESMIKSCIRPLATVKSRTPGTTPQADFASGGKSDDTWPEPALHHRFVVWQRFVRKMRISQVFPDRRGSESVSSAGRRGCPTRSSV